MMKFEFITLHKCGEEEEWLHHFLDDISGGKSLYLQYAYIVMVNL